MSALAPVSSNSESNKRVRPNQDVVVVEESPQKIPCESPVQEKLQVLCTALECEILEGFNSARAAERIANAMPSVLFDLAGLQPMELRGMLNQTAPAKNIQNAVMILYSTSLMNSKYRDTADQLEKKLPRLFPKSRKAYAQRLIDVARRQESIPAPNDLAEIQRLKGQINELLTHLNQYLDLFFYADPENAERILNICTYAKQDSEDLYPNCKQHFRNLCFNLNCCVHEKEQILALRRQLVAKRNSLQLLEVSFYREVEEEHKIPEERAILLKHYGRELWECGAMLLDKAFRNVFAERREKRTFIPRPFATAINTAAREYRGQGLYFSDFLRSVPAKIPDRFISLVWDKYCGQDILELMKYIITQMPKRSFEGFALAIKNKEKELALNTLEIYFRTQLARPLTLVAIKGWIDKTGNNR